MTPSIFSKLSDEIKRKLKDIALSAFMIFLRWLVERLASNPGRGDEDADSK